MSSLYNNGLLRSKASESDNKQEVVSITYEEIGLFPRSFSRVLDRFLKQVFSDVENLVIQEYRFYRYLFLTTLKCLFILFFVPFFVNFLAKTYVVRPLTEYFWNTKQPEIFLNSYQQKHAFAELKDFEEKLYFESLIYPKTAFIHSSSGHEKLKEEPLALGITESPIVSLPLSDGHRHGQGLGYEQVQVFQPPLNIKNFNSFPFKNIRQPENVQDWPSHDKPKEAAKFMKGENTNLSKSESLSESPVDFTKAKSWDEQGTILMGEKIIVLSPKTEGENVQMVGSSVSNKAYTGSSERLGVKALSLVADQPVNSSPLYPSGDFFNLRTEGPVKNFSSEKFSWRPKNYSFLEEQIYDQNIVENNRLPFNSDEKTESLINAYTLKSSLFVYKTVEADKNIQQRYQEKTIELAQRYNDQSIEEITNFFADLISLFTLFYLLYALEIQINITKSFLLEVFFGLDDSKKSLLILLVTDLLVGYHSSNLWELFFEFLFHHYGLPESQTGIFLLVATLPVLLDVLFKYLIFRHLNRSSPATVATYHAMIE
nr:Chloroplast envelope membrane protein [Chlorogonium euchlorum]